MRAIIHPKAGKITLVQFNADGTLSLTDASKYIGANGTVQTIKTSIDVKSSELPDGNSDWPMGVYDTGRDGSIEVTMSSFQPKIYAALMGVTTTAETNQKMWAAEEEQTIPATAAYTVDLEHAVAAGGTIVVLDQSGSPLVSVASGPAANQFTVSSATLTFNSADANKAIFCTYEFTAPTSEKLYLPTSGVRPALHAIISTEATSDDQITTYDANIIVDKAKASGAMSPPPLQREPQPWTFTLKVLKPRGGFNPVYWRYAQRA